MKLIVISPESEDAREHTVLAQLFAAGLTGYHLRKPTWAREQLAAWLCALPREFLSRIVLHTHHELAREFGVGGVHQRDSKSGTDISVCAPKNHTGRNACATLSSRAVHDLDVMQTLLDHYDRLLVSPVFPSISKPGHAPDARMNHDRLKAALVLPRRAEVIALGGIDASRIAACRELGFDGVAVLGAIWQAADPLNALNELQSALHAHAA